MGSSPDGLAPSRRLHHTTPSLHPVGGDVVATTRGAAPGPRVRTLALRGRPRGLLRWQRCSRFPRAVPPPPTGSGHLHAGCRAVRQQAPPELIPPSRLPAVLTSSRRVRHVLSGFPGGPLPVGHLPWFSPGLVLLRSPPWLLTTAAGGGLDPAPARRFRGASPHRLYRYALRRPLFGAVFVLVAHSRRHT